MFKTGHSLIKAKMKEINSPLGGEMSGHIFFKERWYGFDDGTYAGCRLLEIVTRSTSASAVLNALPTSHATPELNVKCAEGEPHALVKQLEAAVQTPDFLAQAQGARGRDGRVGQRRVVEAVGGRRIRRRLVGGNSSSRCSCGSALQRRNLPGNAPVLVV